MVTPLCQCRRPIFWIIGPHAGFGARRVLDARSATAGSIYHLVYVGTASISAGLERQLIGCLRSECHPTVAAFVNLVQFSMRRGDADFLFGFDAFPDRENVYRYHAQCLLKYKVRRGYSGTRRSFGYSGNHADHVRRCRIPTDRMQPPWFRRRPERGEDWKDATPFQDLIPWLRFSTGLSCGTLSACGAKREPCIDLRDPRNSVMNPKRERANWRVRLGNVWMTC